MPEHAPTVPEKLSAVVVSYNRAAVIGTCLRAVSFADEVIVVDKCSTDATPKIAAHLADRFITVPWTPAVEDTRAFAVDQCTGDWILCLDDDECLSPQSGGGIRSELAEPRADIYYLPLRHYILGVHDEAAYYWPEHHPRLFRRDAVAFTGTVHGGMRLCSDRTFHLPPESGVVIHHLSHRDIEEWIEKCNRYTSRPDRQRVEHEGHDLVSFAHRRLDHWLARTKDRVADGYPSAAAVLRALYDIVDRLKTWEEERELDGSAAFVRICAALDADYAALPAAASRAAVIARGCPIPPATDADAAQAALRARIAELRMRCDANATDADAAQAALRARIAELRMRCDANATDAARRAAEAARSATDATRSAAEAARSATDATHWAEEAARLDAELSAAISRLEGAQQALTMAQRRIEAIESSTSWRATEGARRLAEQAKRLVRRR
jgi:glycosyltransferase involved in cell wall biosynthesis